MSQQLYSKITGQGPPVIILHGLLGTSDNWHSIAASLAEHYTVCLLDLRNHGRSFHSHDFNYELMAQDVMRFMSDNWIQSASVIGHSMGGKVAMYLALHEPDLVDRLLVADIGVKDYPPGHLHIFDALSSVNLNQLTERRQAQDFLEDRLQNKDVVLFLMKNLTRDKEGHYHWKMNLPAIIANYDNIMKGFHESLSFDKPTLFVKGSRSEYIKDDDRAGIRSFFPNATFSSIEGAGHWLHADNPEAFLQICLAFLD